MLKKIISLLLIVLLLNSLVGCGGSNIPVIPDNEEEFSLKDINLIYDADLSGNVLVFAGKENGEAIVAFGEKTSDGMPKKITGVGYTAENSESLFIEIGNDGLPSTLIDSNGTKVVYSNYTDTTVEIEIYDKDNNLISGPEIVEFDQQMMSNIKQFSQLDKNNIRGNLKIGEALKDAGFILGIAVCSVLIVFGSPAIATAAAISFVVSSIIYISENTLASEVNIIYKGWTCTGIDCVPVVISAIGTFLTIDEENKILDTIENFGDAMNNEQWTVAKTYCLPNSEAITLINDYQAAFEQVYDMCDQFSYQCSGFLGNPKIEVIEGEIFTDETVMVTFSNSSGSCIMTCTIGSEDFTLEVGGSGYEIYYLEKVEGIWLIFAFEGNYDMDMEEM